MLGRAGLEKRGRSEKLKIFHILEHNIILFDCTIAKYQKEVKPLMSNFRVLDPQILPLQ